ncbi:MAG: hypothetical protein ACT4N8_03335 [Sphingosinicella sp.]|uniref:hypothetical protein n=1 Tax=Sphingosinicella sp. TaxID=1917971 RepID=UPI004037E256
MADYPLAETQIIWNPTEDSTLPPVALVKIPGEDDDRYISSWGACNGDFVEADPSTKLSMLYRQFIHLVINEGVAAADVHTTFMQIPEYRQGLAELGIVEPDED